jgi:hypothetical protein
MAQIESQTDDPITPGLTMVKVRFGAACLSGAARVSRFNVRAPGGRVGGYDVQRLHGEDKARSCGMDRLVDACGMSKLALGQISGRPLTNTRALVLGSSVLGPFVEKERRWKTGRTRGLSRGG